MARRNDAATRGINRRSFLGRAATISAVVSVPISVPWMLPSQAGATLLRQQHALRQQPAIRPRTEWDQGNGPTGPIEAEDPLFLLVHHTAQPGNNYTSEDVPGLLRSMYWFHSGDEKGWADIAYNFLVDQFGTIWEGRTGSIAGPVRGSATGGNQGFSQLCCFIGNLSESEPTPAATNSMVELLAWLAVQRNIDIEPGATVTFTSRGSNKWPQGTEITTPTIAGHRDMSQTSCPGDSGYAFVTNRLPVLVLAKVNGVEPPPADDPDSGSPDPETTSTTATETSATETAETAGSSTTDATEPSTETTTTAETNTTGHNTSSPPESAPSAGSSELGSELEESLSVQPESTVKGWTDGSLRWALPAAAVLAGGAVTYRRTTESGETPASDNSGSTDPAAKTERTD